MLKLPPTDLRRESKGKVQERTERNGEKIKQTNQEIGAISANIPRLSFS